jgi:DNA-directed RNA polymerase specialized sigma24 family protein
MNEEYLAYLDNLNNEERSVFFYRLVLKLPTEETAQRLKISVRKTKYITKILQEQKELIEIKNYIYQSFLSSSIC